MLNSLILAFVLVVAGWIVVAALKLLGWAISALGDWWRGD